MSWFEKTGVSVGPEYDICLQSHCTSEDSRGWLIPMIDFQRCPTPIEWKGIFQTLNENFQIKVSFIFQSGRSSHLYALPLLPVEQAVKFFGTLLLFNSKNDELVDVRWIGHALVKQYCALRRTSNNKWYLQIPKLEIEYHHP